MHRVGQDAAQRYEQGQYQQARFALQQLTDQCFACHSRFTHPQSFDLGKRFLTTLPLAQLSLRDQVRLAVATRQFDTALETCETLFRSTTMWVTETPFFLEMAIRPDPSSPMAAKAYDLLNAYMLAAYTGSGGVHLPEEVQE